MKIILWNFEIFELKSKNKSIIYKKLSNYSYPSRSTLEDSILPKLELPPLKD